MTTMNKVIEQVDGLKPNTFGKEEKFRWLCELDGMVKRLVHQEPEGVNYAFPDDMDTPLLIPPPFEGLYALYLAAQIDRYHQEYNEYNNTITIFNAQLDDFKKAYIREHMPKSAGPIRGV